MSIFREKKSLKTVKLCRFVRVHHLNPGKLDTGSEILQWERGGREGGGGEKLRFNH